MESDNSNSLKSPRTLQKSLLINVLKQAYETHNPLQTLRKSIPHMIQNLKISDIQDFMKHVKWNKTESLDLEHPMHHIIKDLDDLRKRAKEEGLSEHERIEKTINLLCYFGVCVSHIWCEKIVEPDHIHPFSRGFMNPKYEIVAFKELNVPCPYVWFHVFRDGEVKLRGYCVNGDLEHATMYVCLYRRLRMGVGVPSKMAFRFDGQMEVSTQNATIVHILMDATKDTGDIALNIIHPSKNYSFMIFLSRHQTHEFVNATYTNHITNQLTLYPVAMHQCLD